jgi:hypothetical protein
MKTKIACLIFPMLLSMAAAAPGWSAENALLGTWTLDVARSRIDYAPLPRSERRSYQAVGDNGIVFRVEGVDGAGAAYAYGTTGAIDGNDYPMPGAGTRNGGDTVSWRRIDAYTVDALVKKQGDIVNRGRLSVSMDGKVLTITENGTSPSGAPTHGVRVYTKQ